MRRDKRGRFLKGTHWRKQKPHWNYDWLYNMYINRNMSVMEIAELVGCKRSNIQYWLNKHKIPTRNVSEVRKLKHWGSVGKQNGMYGKIGKRNPNWKGGCSPERQKLYSSTKWKKLVQCVFKRDNYVCQRCGCKKSKGNAIHIHHIVSFSKVDSRMDINNLILLCKKCHSWVHSNKNTKKELINEK